jgi:hypothetical protein
MPRLLRRMGGWSSGTSSSFSCLYSSCSSCSKSPLLNLAWSRGAASGAAAAAAAAAAVVVVIVVIVLVVVLLVVVVEYEEVVG